MFQFHRFIVDEYHYIEAYAYPMLSSLKSRRRWILSATPPLEDFADVKNMATALGVYLGRDDDATEFTKKASIKAIQADRTGKVYYYLWIRSC